MKNFIDWCNRGEEEVFKNKLQSKYPSLFNVAGGVINQILTWATDGKDKNYIEPTERKR